MLTLLLASALAQDEAPVRVDAGGHLKTFLVASLPYEHVFMASPDCADFTAWEDCVQAGGQGLGDVRLWAEARTERFTFKAHHTTTMVAPGASVNALGGTGIGLQPPQLAKLSWTAVNDEGLAVRGRADRLSVGLSIPHLDVTVGRQPVTFGRALFFTPLDLVNPFNPTVVDQEYKPGVDALRLDGYWGMAGHATLVAAWTGTPVLTNDDPAELDLSDAVLAAYGQGTVGVWDLGAFAGLVRNDRVVGLSTSGSIRSVGVHAEASGTLPQEDTEDPFARAVVGATWFATGDLMLMGEAYAQTNGTNDPTRYLNQYTDPRYARGELWLAGRYYMGLSASYALHPLLNTSVAVIANLDDPSALVAPALSWSVSDEVSASVSGFVGVGARPDDLEPLDLLAPDFDPGDSVNSEFGLMPRALFVSMAAYR